MFRRAEIRDVERISEIYDALHSREEAGRACIGWVRGVYPTRETARAAVDAGDMFVLEEDGRVVAAARINRIQVPEYANAAWRHPAPDAQGDGAAHAGGRSGLRRKGLWHALRGFL